MKRIRKFIAAALAGLLALMLLAGCEEAPVPQAPTDTNAELVAIMNDILKSPTLSNEIVSDVKEFKADSQLNAKAQNAAAVITDTSNELNLNLLSDQIEKALPIMADDPYIYRVGYAKISSYKTEFFNKYKTYEIARALLTEGEDDLSYCYLNQYRGADEYIRTKDSVASVGFAQTKDGSYIVAVMCFPAELPK